MYAIEMKDYVTGGMCRVHGKYRKFIRAVMAEQDLRKTLARIEGIPVEELSVFETIIIDLTQHQAG
jgi:hypothetical protein